MPLHCALKNCGSSQSNSLAIILHAFPQFNPHHQQWIDFVNRSYYPSLWQPKISSRLCSLHFRDSEYYVVNGNRRLKPNAIPTVSFESDGELTVMESERSYSEVDISQDYGQNKSTQ